MLVRRGDPALGALEREGVAAAEIDLRGLPRRLGAELALWGARLPACLAAAHRIAGDFSPRAVVGMGGYLTFPAVLAAARRGLPRAVHESNVTLGLANRASLLLGAELFRGLPAAGAAPGLLTGTPVRPSLWAPAEPGPARRRLGLAEDKTTVLVFGGSQGARALNRLVPEALAKLDVSVLHLSGPKDERETALAYARRPGAAKVRGFLDAMEDAYAAADLVVCRAGASTLAELAAQRKPALLIPFPHATGAHQEANARVLEACGAAQVLLEDELPARLGGALADLLSHEGAAKRRSMSSAYVKLGLPAPALTAGRLADAVETLAST